RTYLVDDRRRVVFLFLRRKPVVGVQVEAGLIGVPALLLARLGDRRNQLGLAPPVAGRLVEGLALGIKGMVPGGFLVRGIEDRLLEKGADLLRHSYKRPSFASRPPTISSCLYGQYGIATPSFQ